MRYSYFTLKDAEQVDRVIDQWCVSAKTWYYARAYFMRYVGVGPDEVVTRGEGETVLGGTTFHLEASPLPKSGSIRGCGSGRKNDPR